MMITRDRLRKIALELQRNTIHRVETDEEARAMTERDLFDYVWHIGDAYYLAYSDPIPLSENEK
jgi:hypothetical protein